MKGRNSMSTLLEDSTAVAERHRVVKITHAELEAAKEALRVAERKHIAAETMDILSQGELVARITNGLKASWFGLELETAGGNQLVLRSKSVLLDPTLRLKRKVLGRGAGERHAPWTLELHDGRVYVHGDVDIIYAMFPHTLPLWPADSAAILHKHAAAQLTKAQRATRDAQATVSQFANIMQGIDALSQQGLNTNYSLIDKHGQL